MFPIEGQQTIWIESRKNTVFALRQLHPELETEKYFNQLI